MAKYNIGGYIFNDENSATKAAKELKAVEYILGQIRTADEAEVLGIYKKILKQKLFSTPVGMDFIKQLRENLVASGAFNEEDIPPVYDLVEEPSAPVPTGDNGSQTKPVNQEPSEAADVKEAKQEKSSEKLSKKKDGKKAVVEKDASTEIKRLRRANSFLILCVFTLLLWVIGMFYVSTTINSPTILNYKEVITDEYSSWKQELDEREKELDEREAKLREEYGVSGIEE